MKSIFFDKEAKPTDADVKNALADTFDFWSDLVVFTRKMHPNAKEEWKFSGAKYGWSFQVRDKKRVIIYLLPRDRFFKVAFVFGQKATDTILKTDIAQHIKIEISNAKVYSEGRGIRIDIKDNSLLENIKELIKIKISN